MAASAAPPPLPYVGAGVVLMALGPLLVIMSQNSEGQFDYNPVTSTLGSEVLKIMASAGLLAASADRGSVRFHVGEALSFAVPSLIYFIDNNLVFFILQRMDATTFQLLSQLKIAFTVLLFRVILKRDMTKWQYIAIWQLTVGCAVANIPVCASAAGAEGDMFGVVLMLISCALSALGGIYSEKLLKDRFQDSIHWQNIQLYAWGILLNVIGSFMYRREMEGDNIFKGYNIWAFALTFNNALNGLAISAILKFADNIVRCYAHAIAMLATMVASVFLFGHAPTAQLLLSIAAVSASALQFNLKEDRLIQKEGRDGGAPDAASREALKEGGQVVGRVQLDDRQDNSSEDEGGPLPIGKQVVSRARGHQG